MEDTVVLEVHKLRDILNNMGELEKRLESIGIDNGDFYTLASISVSMLTNILIEAGVDLSTEE